MNWLMQRGRVIAMIKKLREIDKTDLFYNVLFVASLCFLYFAMVA